MISLSQGRLQDRRPLSVIDIGSNSIRLVVYEGIARSPTVLFNEKMLAGLGRGIVSTLSESRSPAVLMANHGPFTIGKDARAAVKAAVMCEDVARTVHIAQQLGDPQPIDPAKIDSLYERYQNVYGQ